MTSNPYSLIFGKEPSQAISRSAQTSEIIEAFREDTPSQQAFIITGVRGSGKTVLMTEITRELARDDDWICMELNPERDMLQALAAKLASETAFARIFRSAKIDLSFFGLGVEIGGIAPITDIEVALAKMIESLSKRGKRILISIDEATSTPGMRVFASAFQILIRKDLPVFLLMTGLYENIRALQDEEGLTFLHRAPRIETTPLNTGAMAANYRKILGTDDPTSLSMAKLTKGYPFAFQVLGWLVWRNGKRFDEDVVSGLRQHLEDYVYEKIWSELSPVDRRVVQAIERSGDGKVAHVRELLDMDTNHFNPYRKRLIQKGLVDGSTHGYVKLTLPFFGVFAVESGEDF